MTISPGPGALADGNLQAAFVALLASAVFAPFLRWFAIRAGAIRRSP